MKTSRPSGWRALAIAGLWPGVALAQAPADIDSVVVTARRNPEEPPVVAEARARLSETPGAVSVISAESYESRLALALDDMLRDAPGVYAQRKWGGDIRISIRGSGIGNANHNRGLLIAQDGLPLNEADGFGDSQVADPLTTRYVEVYRGGNALRFGGALLGGAINMVTPTGADAGYASRARLEGGSFGLAREHFAIARRTGEWDLHVAGTNQTGQGARPQSQQNIQYASMNLGRSFGDDREIRLIVNGSNINQEIPGALTLAEMKAGPRQAAPGAYAGDQGRHQRGVRALLRARWRLSESSVIEGGVYGLWKDLDHPIFQVIDQESRNWGAFGRVDWQGKVAGLRADALAGVWLRTGDLDSNFYQNIAGARGAPTSISLQNASAADVFVEGRLFVTERLAAVAGATWGEARRDYTGLLPFRLEAAKRYDWLAPRIGLLWEAPDGAQAFANLTRSVEPPNFSSMSPQGTGFAAVRAQEAWTAEAGLRGRRGRLTWDLAIYRAWLDGEMLQYTVAPGVPATTFNADRTIHQGIEASLDWRIMEPLRLRQTWTWSDFRFREDREFTGKRLPITPRGFYRAELRYEPRPGWYVAPSLEWSATPIWVDYRNTTKAPAYAVFNLAAGLTLGEHAALFVDVRNLADKAYVSNVQAQITATPASAAYWPGDPRSIFGGLTWTF